MLSPPHPFTRDLVLIGGGHTHALLLRSWGMKPLPGARLTLISPNPTAAYSGMLPGHIAGHYERKSLEIDLVQLARFANARLVLGAATAIDLHRKEICVPGRPPIEYDVASIDIGITTNMADLPGFAEYAVPAKPLETFADAWQAFLSTTGPAAVAVIGGGVAGAELVLAMSHALGGIARPARLHLIERDTALAALPARASRRMRRALIEAGIEIHEAAEVIAVTAEGVRLADRTIEAGFICGAAGARPHPWLAQTGLSHRDGFVTVDPRLQSSDRHVFAVGDCADMAFAPRPKAGVYAVRQAPILAHNLRAALRETGQTQKYHPQADYLKLLSLGGKSALGDRFGLTFSGPWVWRWKNRIDQKFMSKFRDLPQMQLPPLPAVRAAGAEALGDKVLCGGCGAKLGQSALLQALEPGGLPGDDAAVIDIGGARTVISTDHLREFVSDPVTMTRIAAQHALGDVWAMGARPGAVLTNLILPRMSPALATRTLREIMTAAREVMANAGAEIVGGHSSQGSELTIGFTVTGLCDHTPVGLAGARPGDALILTKPLGSGVLMAAEMAGRAHGADVSAALDLMMQSQAQASEILLDAHAMTDVTGFGLLGHLRNICLNSAVGAEVTLGAVPLMAGALDLSANGIRSSLYPDNRAPFPDLDATPRHDLLIDPQTAGGLLAAVTGDVGKRLTALRAAGYQACDIGRITDETGQIRIV
ncbi:selenide, water dikinase SelD [Antarctobacter heliothermus]|uniref:Selenophosphate synthase n=1 Tax=Antarctobacter heliothermus TaxID=74033 RepID=A0A239HQS0_9RHOB|nr:selenide, water dikinase SelD [Antarctobacter heliothermus]SNS83273.1 selenophosphate synthase [Antarctobacter heliothermus]